MRLFIAQILSVARVIAEELGITRLVPRALICGEDVVTWCFGHMQAEPDEYTSSDAPRGANGKKLWRDEDLRIIPRCWLCRPRPQAQEQLSIIGHLLKEASCVINAGDPDREGQLLVDELLEHLVIERPDGRYWVSAIDSISVQRELASLKLNAAFVGYGAAARARARSLVRT